MLIPRLSVFVVVALALSSVSVVAGGEPPRDGSAVDEAGVFAPGPDGARGGSSDSERRPLFSRPVAAGGAAARIAPKAESGMGVVDMLLPLGGVVALAVGCAWVLRRAVRAGGGLSGALGAGGRAPAGILEVLGRYPVGRGQSLVLLRVGRRVLLLGQSHGGRGGGAGFSTLAQIDDADEVATILQRVGEAEGRSLADRFQAALARVRDGEGSPGVDASAGRRTLEATDGDRAELWDDALATASIEAGPVEGASDARARRAATAADPVRALRERIAAMQTAGAGGAGTDGVAA